MIQVTGADQEFFQQRRGVEETKEGVEMKVLENIHVYILYKGVLS